MSRIVIYGIGSVLSKIKSNIVWSNIAAVIVCKDMIKKKFKVQELPYITVE